MPHDPATLLDDMERAGTAIQTFLHGADFARYSADEMLRSAVERKFSIIGEALNRLLVADAALAAQITDYRRIIDFRNVLIHSYAKVDNQVVWDAAQMYLPVLLTEVRRLRQGLLPP
jgi:uncharacterized protein with HEPN domain